MTGNAAGLVDKDLPSPQWIADIRRRYRTEAYVDRALTRKLERRGGPPYVARRKAEVVDQLRAFLRGRVPEPFDISGVSALAGGSSKEQFRFTLTCPDVSGDYVLRMQPAASIVETHRQREFDALRALRDVLPVPAAMWCDPEGEAFGEPALITTFVEGLTKPPAEGLGEVTGPRQGFGPHYRRLIAPNFMKVLTDLHAFDWRGATLGSFDVPAAGSNEAVLWAVDWWLRVWEEDSLEPVPLITYAAGWLKRNAPVVDQVSLLHGDFRGGNFLFDPDTGAITAMLDWELAHLGDRHEDLAYIMSPLFAERGEDGRLLINGFWPEDEFLPQYEQLSGLTVDRARLDYYRVYHGWRSAIITLATAPRCAAARKTHQDILLGWIAGTGFVAIQELYDVLAEAAA